MIAAFRRFFPLPIRPQTGEGAGFFRPLVGFFALAERLDQFGDLFPDFQQLLLKGGDLLDVRVQQLPT